MTRLQICFTFFLVVLLCASGGCRSDSADPAMPPQVPVVSVAKPDIGTIQSTITLPGDLIGYYQSTLYAKVTGYLKSISVDKGDWVKAGQVLAVIEVPELKERLGRSAANLEIARLTYDRLQNVWKSDPRLVARQDVDISYAKYKEAQAEDEELRALYSYTLITAPFDGVITARYVDPGALIHAGAQDRLISQGERTGIAAGPVVSIARVDEMRIYVYTPQNEVPFIHVGQPATVTLENGSLHYQGQVARFAHSLDLATRTMLTEIDLRNPDHKLYPGMYANVTLVLQQHTHALRIPQEAVGGAHSDRVFVVDNHRLKEVHISTGLRDGHYIEVLSGLNPNDLVVQHYAIALQPGEQVESRVVQNTAALASQY
ncbi:MAG TPA: efflux RND transporter periplasmic adaptor subunit [Candidatus Binataceae bacterium]|jgi:RND family efflux transporter MFP subunit|nr:efflux RND transporter periplasmic adaptor subunit [Candidatus Binataceae bacterium]